ncbi:HAMP domain-containing sensor histidine kinase [Metasolibacillus sp.]|uniref:sensor histidine kinase n=1 Tax=Metasolibacillus sp. TaxID=2703680 RepID=UPI0025E02588|nr:HAMP domain-containing sensor histidine kinase [Metasolibacillus sp.]MCT6923904.1 HAMP domain-containing histidine kinase [Metasolibacillus sp.]MCT6940442.1 HAMP domain-containing histidine kinase [Metasolibacillus sp.]
MLKREVKRAYRQLNAVNRKETEKKLDLQFWDKDLQKLAETINAQIDLTKQATAEKRQQENELKQAIANISHDIRTPLTSILGYIQFLEQDNRSQYTAIIKRGALRLKDLLEDFFELSLIESTDYLLKPEHIKMNQLLSEVLVGFYDQFHQANLQPTIDMPTQELTMIADSSAVKRVIENLVLNTIKHAHSNVLIRLEQEGHIVRLMISNEVTNLSEKDVNHLFQRFYKGDKTRAENGTGLGLAIAKSLMQKMNGQLSAELQNNRLTIICEWRWDNSYSQVLGIVNKK